MAYRGSVHRGTPYTKLGPTSNQGFREGGKPGGFEGTQPQGYGSEKGGYRDAHTTGHGTPYNSRHGNTDEAKRLVSRDPHGHVISENGINHNDPRANGAGVVLDGANRPANGHAMAGAPLIDSPVPGHSPKFDPAFMDLENRQHLGSGNESAASENITAIGGVLSRGMVGTSKPSGPETELTKDDDFPGG
jgi:hypothetical protein